MNVKWKSASFCILCLLIKPAWGELRTSLWNDPLMAQPQQLEDGATLPDASKVNCVTTFDAHMPLELTDAVNTALCNNPQIRASWAQIKAQTGSVGEARAAYLPTISGSVSRLRNSTNYDGGSRAQDMESVGNQYYGSLSWRLFDFGGREATREEANQMLIAAIAGHDAAMQKTMSAVIQAYFEAVTSQTAMIARTHITQIAQQTLDVAQRRERKGATAQGDTLQSSTALARAELNEMRAKGDYQKNLALLKQAMGISLNTRLTLPVQPDRVTPTDFHDLSIWLKEAESRHPSIKEARAKWKADRQKIITTESEGLPVVDLTAHMSKNGFPNQGLSTIGQTNKDIGITISVPLFEGFSRQYKIMEARAQAEQSQAQVDEATTQILTDVVKAYADAETAVGVMAASEKLMVTANTSMTSVMRRYNNNVADMLEVLNAQSALADAQQQKIEAIAQWRSARLHLLASTGILGRVVE